MTQLPTNTEQLRWPGKIPLTSLYTAGTAGQIFFHALKTRGKLIATRCSPCEQVYLPARSFCQRCLADLTEQVEIKPSTHTLSYTISSIHLACPKLRT